MLPMSRGESFLENRVFSNPDEVEWGALDLQTRRDFVKHSDRGVFDPPSLAAIAYDDRCRFVTGRVTDVGAAGGGEGVRLEYESPEGPAEQRARLRRQLHRLRPAGAAARPLPGAGARARSRARSGRSGTGPPGPRCRSAAASSWRGCSRGCTSPASAGLSQGPGFANLGALGLLSNRVLQPLLARRAPSRDLATRRICNINLYRLSNMRHSTRGELT